MGLMIALRGSYEMGGVPEIGNIELLCAAGFMLVAGLVSYRSAMGLEKDIAISTLRAFVQLIALGFVLGWVFDNQSWEMVLLIMFIMVLNATQIARGRIKSCPSGITLQLFVSLLITSFTMVFLVVELIVKPELWYDARVVVGIFGMILGNAMSSSAVALDRTFSSLDARSDEVLALISLGATPLEAARPSIMSAVRAGMIPTLATLSAAGVVQIPGMMTGQVLAGADPLSAAKYQLVLLMAISATTTLCNIAVVRWCFRKRFSSDGYYLDSTLRGASRSR
jgi:putative ABC transport system permease protein